MADPYLGEIRIFAGNFAPAGWMFCNGQILPLSQYAALFSILGTRYGGNGTTNFALPNLQGSVPIGSGTGPGLTPRDVGDAGGSSTVTLGTNDMPVHNHVPMGYATDGTVNAPSGAVWAQTSVAGRHGKTPVNLFNPAPDTPMSPAALGVSGGSQPHNNMQPFLGLNFIICMDGEFPQRS